MMNKLAKKFQSVLISSLSRGVVLALAVFQTNGLSGMAAGSDLNEVLRNGYKSICSGEHEEAVATLSAALQVNPASIEARRYLAYALLHMGLAQQAVQQFEYVNRLNPNSAPDLFLLGDAHFYAGQYEKALARYRQSLELDVGLDSARAGMVHTYIAMGRPDYAMAICQQALGKVVNPAKREFYEGLLQDVQGKPEEQPRKIEE
jgi:tetratricopeptide (TPR) repeat protein